MHGPVESVASLLIGGAWRDGADSMPVTNPFTGSTVAQVACANADDVRQAVASAVGGAARMRGLTTERRAAILHRAADALAARAREFAESITVESGKPITASTRETARAVNTLRLSAEEASRLNGETIAFDSFDGGAMREGYYRYEPVGVVVAITPFNDPLNLACHKLGPAIAAGNSVILKPADQAPLTALMLVQLLLDAGLPADAIAVLTGRGADFGPALVSARDVAMVSFTGGPKVGQEIARTAGVKRISMELGGNGAVIVAADADLEKAATACASGAFWASGQNCIGVQRIFVHAAVYDSFRELMIARCRALVAGDPTSPATDVGPLISNCDAERMAAWTAEAVAAGARVCCGGTRDGALFQPTILENAPDHVHAVSEEAFGPIVTLIRYETLDAAVAAANRADHTIHAAIFTRDIGQARHAAHHLRAGGVMINDSTDYRLDAMPFGGAGQGNMGREGVRFAMREMAQTKVVCFNYG